MKYPARGLRNSRNVGRVRRRREGRYPQTACEDRHSLQPKAVSLTCFSLDFHLS